MVSLKQMLQRVQLPCSNPNENRSIVTNIKRSNNLYLLSALNCQNGVNLNDLCNTF